jgi:hypothetical protein
MGQLEVYSLEDLSFLSILLGPVTTYFSDEIEVSIESVVAYVYSANTLYRKKRSKLILIDRPVGELYGAAHYS